ncbi:MAG: hypothetical protein IT290_08855 [Deltaproteobacteria bacterium]|nr:hypothetical protein [Deltaproteobacteria bacterium]
MKLALVDILITSFVRTFVAVLSVLPERLAIRCALGFVQLGIRFTPRYRAVAARNLELIFPEKSKEEHERIFQGSLRVLARNLQLFAIMPTLKREQLEQMFDYTAAREKLKELNEKGAGAGLLILTLHYGCFELLVQAHSCLWKPTNILARDFGLPRLDRYWWGRRQHFGSRVFSRSGGYREIVTRLRAGEDVAVLFDQNVKASHASFVDFFGIKAATTRAPAVAALRGKSPVVVTVTVEVAPNKFEVLFEEVPSPAIGEGTNEERIAAFLEHTHRVAERFIRLHPEQWFWIHRRFKTRPAGEPENMYSV